MDRANQAVTKASTTPKTDELKFVITPKDVGSEAVRAGHMAEMEEQREVLMVAAKLVMQRAAAGNATLDAVSQNALEVAGGMVKMAMEIKTGAPVTDSIVEKLLADTKKDIKIEQAREILINRMMLLLKGFQDSNRPLEWQARQVVDTILVEVT